MGWNSLDGVELVDILQQIGGRCHHHAPRGINTAAEQKGTERVPLAEQGKRLEEYSDREGFGRLDLGSYSLASCCLSSNMAACLYVSLQERPQKWTVGPALQR